MEGTQINKAGAEVELSSLSRSDGVLRKSFAGAKVSTAGINELKSIAVARVMSVNCPYERSVSRRFEK